jgi:Chalcone isomerase-like
MHHASDSINRRAFAINAASLGLAALASTSAIAQPAAPEKAKRLAPAELNAFPAANAWSLMGSGALRFFGFKAYDAYLWSGEQSANPLLSKTLFALEIDYATAIKADEITNVSLVEMARLRSLNESQVKAWTAELKKAFPDVKSGDKLTGVFVPKIGTRFFFNGRLTAEINDPAFGDAFFAIWLDEKGKRPELRRALLGQR